MGGRIGMHLFTLISAILIGLSGRAYRNPVWPVRMSKPQEAMRRFTPAELKGYDGTDPGKPIYLSYEGNVYDVTAGRKFYIPGGPYHDLAGTDATRLLHIAGGNIIRKKYPVIGTLGTDEE